MRLLVCFAAFTLFAFQSESSAQDCDNVGGCDVGNYGGGIGQGFCGCNGGGCRGCNGLGDALSLALDGSMACSGREFTQARYRSLIWAGVDTMWLTHSGSRFRSEILDPNNNAVTVSQTLEHGFPVALRFRLGSLLTETLRTELVYFGTDGWESTAQIQNVPPVPDLDATINYDAEIQSFEANLISSQSDIDSHWLIGLRYLQYQDSFVEDYRLNPGSGTMITETARGEAINEAIGPQIGAGLDLGGGNTLLHFGCKLGFMNNQIHQTGPSFDNAILIDGNPETTFDNQSNEFAWLGDLDVTVTRSLSPNITVRMGYQGLFLDNVAQSATQNGRQATPGQISFHGLVIGAEFIR
jgi:hypothetical protein